MRVLAVWLDLFVCLIGVLRRTQEYFTYMTARQFSGRPQWVEETPGRNQGKPPTGHWLALTTSPRVIRGGGREVFNET